MTLTDVGWRPVVTVRAAATVAEAARSMCAHTVGALVITDDSDETALGIITDRDLVWMISEGLDPRIATVSEFLQGHLETARVTDTLAEITNKMRAAGVRRLPVLDQESHLVGLVSLDDVLGLLGREIADLAGAIDSELGRERVIAGRATSAASH
ncbi:MAG: CBS domain-containing protein [Thermodesulfobacteriota bacterium]